MVLSPPAKRAPLALSWAQPLGCRHRWQSPTPRAECRMGEGLELTLDAGGCSSS